VPFASAQSSAIVFIETGNVNATVNTATSATLNWQFTGWDSTQCEFKNISWNEGKGGKQQNSQESVNADGAGDLSIFGWHIFDIELLVTCGIGTTSGTNTTQFGPFDIIIGELTPQPITDEEDPTIFYIMIGALSVAITGLVIILLRKKW